jgi:hypothetical protein
MPILILCVLHMRGISHMERAYNRFLHLLLIPFFYGMVFDI